MMFSRLVLVATLVSSVTALGRFPIRSAAVRARTAAAAVDPIPTPDQYTHWEEKNYTQLIDHFNFNVNCELGSQTTYTQRYLLNDTYWKRGAVDGPIFLYAGNEGDIELFAQNSGFMWDIAPQFGALLIFPEHRYYGKSYPYPDQKSNVASLQYLTAEQALADYAVMIQDLKHQWNTTAPVIVFGGSYGGMLAAWMRIKYPHVVAGAIAASAPIWQFTDLVDPGMFNFIVTRTFHAANNYCDTGIFQSWSIIRQRLTTGEGRKSLKQIFHLCDDVKETDGDQLVNWIAGNLNSLAMGDYPYPSTFLGPMPANPVHYACQEFKFNQTDDELLQALYHVQHTAIDYTNSSTCYSLNVTGPPTLAADNGWNYQSCNEMVMPIGQYGRNGSTDFQNDMFEYMPWNLTQQIASCESQFVGVTPQPDWITTNWPAHPDELKQTSNIVFSNGNLDPWSGGGVSTNVSDTVVAYIIGGGAHHLDLRGANPLDIKTNVTLVRAAEVAHIRTWINQANAIPKTVRTKSMLRGTGINAAGNPNTVCPSPSSSSGLATKWVAVISVLVTLALVGAALFIKQRWFDPKPTPVVNGDYEAVNH